MSHGMEHHLEEAEHAKHHAADPFDKRVAMTMAIVAACLACVSMLSHRSHNTTIQSQIHANDNLTEASNQWGYFQAKKNRQYMFDVSGKILTIQSKEFKDETAKTDAAELVKDLKKTIAEYKEEVKEIEKEARELTAKAKEFDKEAAHAHHMSDRFDLGELGVELALVFCSLAVLTKRKDFWYGGIGVGTVGFVVAMSAYLIH
jgi:cell division protein FtsL